MEIGLKVRGGVHPIIGTKLNISNIELIYLICIHCEISYNTYIGEAENGAWAMDFLPIFVWTRVHLYY